MKDVVHFCLLMDQPAPKASFEMGHFLGWLEIDLLAVIIWWLMIANTIKSPTKMT